MKSLRLLLSSFFALWLACLQAQTDGLSYQAVIIDNNPLELPGSDLSGVYLSEGEVALRFTIYEFNGEVLYQEIQETITDEYGMVNLVIGQGMSTAQSTIEFTSIDWDGMVKELGVEIAYSGDAYEELSRQELLFIPYAYHRNITATGTLDVDGETTLNSTLTVENGSTTFLTGDLAVNGNTDLNGELAVDGATTLNSSLTVENESITLLTGDLTVEGTTTLNDDLEVNGESILNQGLTVANQSPTTLTGSLDVLGIATFQDTAVFEDIIVENTSTLGGAVTVENQSPTLLSGDLTVDEETRLKGELTVESTSQFEGQVTINASLTGNQSNYNSYPLRVEGGNQGIAVKVNGTEAQNKNFLSFFNGANSVKGRIEGQTLSELQNSFRFIWDVTMGGLDQAFIAAEGVACASQLDGFEAGLMVVNTAVYGAQWVELTANYENNVGVAFLSGGADYAEWIEKETGSGELFPGEVVGIKNGRVSHRTEGADHLLAISTNPIVVGNMPSQGDESKFAKVAFLGQVPIRVIGKVSSGDYVVPSGNNDGMGVAFAPSQLPTHHFNEVIGVAWESSSLEAPALINVAIGLKSNELSNKVASLETEVQNLREEFESLKMSLAGGEDIPDKEEQVNAVKQNLKAEPMARNIAKAGAAESVQMSDEEFEEWLSAYGSIFESYMGNIKKSFREKNIDYSAFSEIALILDNPREALRAMRNGDFLHTVWQNFEQRLAASGN